LEIYVKISLLSINFSIYLSSITKLPYIYTYFTHIAGSSTTDDVVIN